MGSPRKKSRSCWWPRTEIEYWIIIYGVGGQIRKRENLELLGIEQMLLEFLPREITELSTANLCELQEDLIFKICCIRDNLQHPQKCHPLNVSGQKQLSWEEWHIQQQWKFIQKFPQLSICFLGTHSA